MRHTKYFGNIPVVVVGCETLSFSYERTYKALRMVFGPKWDEVTKSQFPVYCAPCLKSGAVWLAIFVVQKQMLQFQKRREPEVPGSIATCCSSRTKLLRARFRCLCTWPEYVILYLDTLLHYKTLRFPQSYSLITVTPAFYIQQHS
jgi:hypothetical protein